MDFEEYRKMEESSGNKLLQKMKSEPMVPIGFVVLGAICGYGIYSFKYRKISTSLFLVQYRVIAQGSFIGCITLGLAYTMLKDFIEKRKSKIN